MHAVTVGRKTFLSQEEMSNRKDRTETQEIQCFLEKGVRTEQNARHDVASMRRGKKKKKTAKS